MLSLIKLENRIVLDGAAMGEAIGHIDHAEADAGVAGGEDAHFADDSDADDAETVAGAAALLAESETPEAPPLDLVLIADDLPDQQTLARAVDGDAVVIRFDADADSPEAVMAQVAELSRNTGRKVGTVTVLSHGENEGFDLGNTRVTADKLGENAGAWRALDQALADEGRIYLFGCNLNGNQALLDGLAEATGAQVYGSDDISGADGDWSLEMRSQNAEGEAAPPLDIAALADYGGALADNTITINEDTEAYAFTAGDFGSDYNTLRITHTESRGSLRFDGQDVTVNQEISIADINAGRLTFTPEPDANNETVGETYSEFQFRLDGQGPYTLSINVTPVQDAPTSLDNAVTTDEDTNYVFDGDDFLFNDVDGDAFVQIRISDLGDNGRLELSGNPLSPGDVVAFSDIVAGQLRFVPGANENGENYSRFNFQVYDGQEYSEQSYTMTVNVTPLNDLPQGTDKTITLQEDGQYTLTAADFGFKDPDTGDSLTKVQITQLETAGTLRLDGVTVREPGVAISLADIAAGKLVFEPDQDANGQGYSNFRFKVSDGKGFSKDANTLTFNVEPVNDPPTASDNIVTTARNTAYTFSAGDFGFSDVDKQDELVQVRITRLAGGGQLQLDGAAVTANQVIAAEAINAGDLTFVPGENDFGEGYASFGFEVQDGTAYSATDYNMTINVTVGNLPPTAADGSVSLDEDSTYTFKIADFGFNDEDPEDSLQSIEITQLETAGTLTLAGSEVGLNQTISAAAIADGELQFTPNRDANGQGYSNFRFKVFDGTDASVASYTMTLNVNPVQDAPSAADNTVRAMEIAPDEAAGYVFKTEDFVFNDVDAEDEFEFVRITELTTTGQLLLNGQPVSLNQEIAVSQIEAGALTFRPVPYENGDAYDSFRFEVRDDEEFSESDYAMTINVAPVNFTPQGPALAPTIAEDSTYTFKLADFEYQDFDQDDLQNIWITRTVTAGTLRLDGQEVGLGDLISPDQIGRLVFTPNQDAFGDVNNDYEYANFQFRVQDTAGSFSNTVYTMPINVTPVNDPPTSADEVVTTAEDTDYVFKRADFAFEDMENHAFLELIVDTGVNQGTLLLNGNPVTADTVVPLSDLDAGNLVFRPDPDESGDEAQDYHYTQFDFRVRDDGGTDPGEDTSVPYTMAIRVTAENDRPDLTPFGPKLTPIHEDEVGNPGTLVSELLAQGEGNIVDLDGPEQGIAITGLDNKAGGVWEYQLAGSDQWVAVDDGQLGEAHALLLTPQDRLRFNPTTQDYNTWNVDDPGAPTFSYRAWDQYGWDGQTRYQDTTENVQTSPFSEAQDIGSVEVMAVNDAPLIHWDVANEPVGTDNQGRLLLTDLRFSDVDINEIAKAIGSDPVGIDNLTGAVGPAEGDAQILEVTLSVDKGTLQIGPEGSRQDENGSQIVLRGTLAQVNAAIHNVIYQGPEDAGGEDVLHIEANDLKNFGPAAGIANLDIALAVNQPPDINLDPNNDAGEGTPGTPWPGPGPAPGIMPDFNVIYVESVDGGCGPVHIADQDATVEDAENHQVVEMTFVIEENFQPGDTLSFDQTLAQSLGITGGFQGNSLSLSGAADADAYQQVLRTVTFEAQTGDPDNPINARRVIRISATDEEGASTSPQNRVESRVDVIPVNDAPLYNGPLEVQTPTNEAYTFTTLSVGDPDVSPDDPVNVNLAVNQGTVRIVNIDSGAQIINNETGNVTLVGTLAQVNAALAGMQYVPVTDGVYNAELVVTTNDQGYTGVHPATEVVPGEGINGYCGLGDSVSLDENGTIQELPGGIGTPAYPRALTTVTQVQIMVGQNPPHHITPYPEPSGPWGPGPYGPPEAEPLGGELGGEVPFPGPVLDTGVPSIFGRPRVGIGRLTLDLAGPAGDAPLYDGCTLEEALRSHLGCRFAPGIDPLSRFGQIRWGDLGWLPPRLDEEFDLFSRLFLREANDPGFSVELGDLADRFGGLGPEQTLVEGARGGFNDEGPMELLNATGWGRFRLPG